MAYKPVDRSYSQNYLEKQHSAMRFLASLGVPLEELRTYHWGMVDEGDKKLTVEAPVRFVKFDQETGKMDVQDYQKKFEISLRGHDQQEFFIKSQIFCHWMFTRERPRTWRTEGSTISLYSLPEVEKVCKGVEMEFETFGNLLTKALKFANIRVSKLNFHSLGTKGETEEGFKAGATKYSRAES